MKCQSGLVGLDQLQPAGHWLRATFAQFWVWGVRGNTCWPDAQVRLEHMLQRLRVLQDAAATARPTRLLPHLWVSGAVEAHSLHVLRHLGITHVLNATEDLLLPEPEAAFK